MLRRLGPNRRFQLPKIPFARDAAAQSSPAAGRAQISSGIARSLGQGDLTMTDALIAGPVGVISTHKV